MKLEIAIKSIEILVNKCGTSFSKGAWEQIKHLLERSDNSGYRQALRDIKTSDSRKRCVK
uniref:Uncharacterized protein n=1 Tax=viral metagenome TaxID=1070528 RepID=A0A6M3LZB3_9ZZZZ